MDINLHGNWNQSVKTRLAEIIRANANNGEFAVFDFDNTTLCRDIGEATMAQLEIDSVISFSEQLKSISPQIAVKDSSISAYYEALLTVTEHQKENPNGHSNAYLWAAQTLAGLTIDKVTEGTEKVFAQSQEIVKKSDVVIPRIGDYAIPYIYPEMASLYGELLKNGIDTYIISASNVWTVRLLVANYLNPLIEQNTGLKNGIKPQNVIGINLLLRDLRDGKLYKDEYLVKSNALYAKLDANELSNYEITNLPALPVSAYAGKVANILAHIGNKQPLLIAGDSPNDFQMLSYSKYKLWIARLEKSNYQKKMLENNWKSEQILVQPVLNSQYSGFYESMEQINEIIEKHPYKDKIRVTMQIVKGLI